MDEGRAGGGCALFLTLLIRLLLTLTLPLTLLLLQGADGSWLSDVWVLNFKSKAWAQVRAGWST
jgi:hypothetical protein